VNHYIIFSIVLRDYYIIISTVSIGSSTRNIGDLGENHCIRCLATCCSFPWVRNDHCCSCLLMPFSIFLSRFENIDYYVFYVFAFKLKYLIRRRFLMYFHGVAITNLTPTRCVIKHVSHLLIKYYALLLLFTETNTAFSVRIWSVSLTLSCWCIHLDLTLHSGRQGRTLCRNMFRLMKLSKFACNWNNCINVSVKIRQKYKYDIM